MKRLFKDIRTVIGPGDGTALLTGESGTGKELAAKAIHRFSSRSKKPLLAINCGAMTRDLVESKLFGHTKGAFTGAINSKLGLFGAADGGTLFLDELGEMALDVQVQLLRVLQEHEFTPVGATRAVPCDVRIIAATNCNLKKMVEAGNFRQDLYYRLEQHTLNIPALRERPDDIMLLAELFLDRFSKEKGVELKGILPQTKALLKSYSWPGNVRELENSIEKAVVYQKDTDAKRLNHKFFPDDLKEKLGLHGQSSSPVKSRFQGITRDVVLSELRVRSPLSVTELVENTSRARTTIQKYVNILEREGFVIVERRIGRTGSLVSIGRRGLEELECPQPSSNSR
jgi:transcriptional regulator with PAS, ATPase and Fis domain